jgi:hypothetical protein
MLIQEGIRVYPATPPVLINRTMYLYEQNDVLEPTERCTCWLMSYRSQLLIAGRRYNGFRGFFPCGTVIKCVKNRGTTYMPIQNRNGCQPPIALKVERFMDFRLSFQKVMDQGTGKVLL